MQATKCCGLTEMSYTTLAAEGFNFIWKLSPSPRPCRAGRFHFGFLAPEAALGDFPQPRVSVREEGLVGLAVITHLTRVL